MENKYATAVILHACFQHVILKGHFSDLFPKFIENIFQIKVYFGQDVIKRNCNILMIS